MNNMALEYEDTQDLYKALLAIDTTLGLIHEELARANQLKRYEPSINHRKPEDEIDRVYFREWN